MAQAVVQAASERGYAVFLVDCRNSLDEEQQGIERLGQYAIEGIIWCPIDDEKSIARNNLACPVVMTDSAALSRRHAVKNNFPPGFRTRADSCK